MPSSHSNPVHLVEHSSDRHTNPQLQDSTWIISVSFVRNGTAIRQQLVSEILRETSVQFDCTASVRDIFQNTPGSLMTNRGQLLPD